MKVSFLFPLFLAATQFVIAAESTDPTTAARDAGIIQRYDTNGDGKLDEAEIAAVKERTFRNQQEKREGLRERAAEWLKEFDKNGDGKLDEAEKRVQEATLRARLIQQPQVMKRLDTNGDGKVSDAEWAAGREKIIQRQQKKKTGAD